MDAKVTGKLIAQKRKEKGLNQIQLGELLNVSNRTVSKWENGDGFPDITLLPDISKCLDITIDELLTGVKPTAAVNDSAEDNKKKLLDEFKIFVIVSFFFAVFSALLGCITEIYNMWAFYYILFYNHWEIIFSAVSLFTSLLSGVAFIAGLARLHNEFSKKELIQMQGRKAIVISSILTLFPLSFLARVIGVSRLGNFMPEIMLAVFLAAAAVLLVLYKRSKNEKSS